jgi:23S rRNA pseudouridine2605 synthase
VSGKAAGTDGNHPGERLQKVLASAGVASRRACETLIAAGRVEVNGDVVTRLGARVDPDSDVIRVDGRRLPVATRHVYLALNKPLGVVSTMADDRGRPDLRSVVGDRPERLFHVGRLDSDTDGLLLLTNDGDLAHRLAHPSFGLAKTYVATVTGTVRPSTRRRLLTGVTLDDGPVTVDACRVIGTSAARSIVEIVVHEGRKHLVRRLLSDVGHPVERLTRTAVGPVRLGTLRPGDMRPLTRQELGALLDVVAG